MITPLQLWTKRQHHANWLRNGSGQRFEAIGADLHGACFLGANLRDACFLGANLRAACFLGANLSKANLRAACLRDADLSSADLRYADLSCADLSCADLRGANLSEACLSGTNLSEACLSGTNLCGVIGNMKEIKSAQFDRWQIVWSADILAIGCQQHPIKMWRNADPRWIAAMDDSATDWWSCYAELVLRIIDSSPATGMVLEVKP
jgi:uncharacterized protein YjbI with pentapeptide repeats